ncbi:MAG: S-methyl-5'-thioinosine phosphorylase [Pigmentiphaga sp.]|nr:S-methyl-5'-thioinosine phosphorylase [Pigmentiphaga sp.]
MRGILGGTGFYRMSGLEVTHRQAVRTPYGLPSGAITFGRIGECDEIAFLPRHGYHHALAPHAINYRANLWALHQMGVRSLIAVSSTSSLRDDWQPGQLVLPDQLIDYTWGRESTFVGTEEGPVVQVDMTLPYSSRLRGELLAAAANGNEAVIEGGTYGCTQGPRLETAAEIRRLARDGCDLVGNTGMPEAALAREIGLDYCALCIVANHAAGIGDSRDSVDFERTEAGIAMAMQSVQRLLACWCELSAGGTGGG